MRSDTWTKIMSFKSKDNRHKGIANTLDNDDINTLCATAEFFGADDKDLGLMVFDLRIARYRVFDWLAMAVGGRISCRPAVKVFAHSFIKSNGDVTAFIDDLRVSDYDMDTEWESIKLDEEVNNG